MFDNKENKELASIIQNHLNKDLNSNREIKKIPNDTYMYSKLKIDGVLIECGFLSNAYERNLLMNSDYQEKVAKVISEGVVDYF